MCFFKVLFVLHFTKPINLDIFSFTILEKGEVEKGYILDNSSTK